MPRCPHCGESHGPEFHFCGKTGQPLDLGPRLIGQVLLGRFQVVHLLGEGPVGAVLEVEQEIDGRRERYAAKMLHPRFARDKEAVRQFLEVAAKAGSTGHRHIAEVVATGRDTGGAPLVVREFMEGESLGAFIARSAPLPVGDAVRITRQILSGLAAAHRIGAPNLDLSPGDIFLVAGSEGGLEPKLVDFGEALLKETIGKEAKARSSPYFAPEVARGAQPDERADLWATAMMLHQMLTGELPYGPSPDWTASPPPAATPVRQLRAEIEPLLEAVLLKALSVDPERRYRSANAFEAALARAIGAKPSLSPKPPKPMVQPAPSPTVEPTAAPAGAPRASAEPSPATRAEGGASAEVGTPRTSTLRLGEASAPPAKVEAQADAPAPRGEPAGAEPAAAPGPTAGPAISAPPAAAPAVPAAAPAPGAAAVAAASPPAPIAPSAEPAAARPAPAVRAMAPAAARRASHSADVDGEIDRAIHGRPLWQFVVGGGVAIVVVAAGLALLFATMWGRDGRGRAEQAGSASLVLQPAPQASPSGDITFPVVAEPHPGADAAADVASPAADAGEAGREPAVDGGTEATDAAADAGPPLPDAAPPAAPAKVRIAISVAPPEARISLDGEPLPSNPYEAEVEASEQTKVVVAAAEGYESQTRRVRFNEDRTLTFALARRPPPAAVTKAPQVARPTPPVRPRGTTPPAAPPRPPPAATGTKRTGGGGFTRDNPFD